MASDRTPAQQANMKLVLTHRGPGAFGCILHFVRHCYAQVNESSVDAEMDQKTVIEPAVDALRNRFIGWQCRLRKWAVREAGGRPSAGMRPRVLSLSGDELAPAMTVLLVPKEPDDSIKLFRYQVLRTADPVERLEKALAILTADYFQDPGEFSEVMTALFVAQSRLAGELRNLGRCRLDFEQHDHLYRIPCSVLQFAEVDGPFQATFWHNRIFNPNLRTAVQVLGFKPDWRHATFQAVE